jgi:[ribosomal protein S18]-alanine N-acetyltransferase
MPSSALAPRLIALSPAMIPVAAALHRAAFGEEAWDEKSIGEILNMPGALGRLAVGAQDQPQGFLLSLHVLDTAELLTLAVDPACRRQGIGRLLVRDLFAIAQHLGGTELFLEVAADNIAAITLYRAEGFIQDGYRRDYYRRGSGVHVDAHVFRRALPQI